MVRYKTAYGTGVEHKPLSDAYPVTNVRSGYPLVPEHPFKRSTAFVLPYEASIFDTPSIQENIVEALEAIQGNFNDYAVVIGGKRYRHRSDEFKHHVIRYLPDKKQNGAYEIRMAGHNNDSVIKETIDDVQEYLNTIWHDKAITPVGLVNTSQTIFAYRLQDEIHGETNTDSPDNKKPTTVLRA